MKLKKLTTLLIIVSMTVLTILPGCGKKNSGDNEFHKAEEEHYIDMETLKNRELTNEAQILIEDLLRLANSQNTYGYPLDESFYLWFYVRYGEDILKKLESKLKVGGDESCYYELTGSTLHVLWVYYCADKGIHPDYLKNVYVKNVDAKTDIIIDFAGDINFDDSWGNMEIMLSLQNEPEHCFSKALLEEMHNADIFMINNECTYTEMGEPLEGKAYTFKAKPEYAASLRTLGVDIVSLANNHVYDYGEEGLISTLETLEDIDMPYVGAGRNLEQASEIVYFIVNGRKIAFTSATQVERSYNFTREATATTPGVLKTLNPDKYLEVIKEARAKADYVIAYVHWGTEDTDEMGSDQRMLGMKYIEKGADVVVGGHTHCLQGFEYFMGAPILYSLGNFWFDWTTAISRHTMLFQIVIHEDNKVDYRVIPCEYENGLTYKIENKEELDNALGYIRSLSDGVTIDNDGYVREAQ
ncbi:MAG: CapA family protein [Lachnospiraceae bacterium]|nr:CapA family protein [Lachnospiraceae bacterium]